jgi:Flp pilus assembly protein TadG
MTPRRRPNGQTLVEFALVVPIFFLLLFGLIDMGRFVYMNSTLSQAAREAARVASVEASWLGRTDTNCNTLGGPVCPANLSALRADVLTAANRMITPFGSIASADLYTSCDDGAATPPTGSWTSQTCNAAGRSSGDLVSVRVVLVFRPITPIVGQLFSSITTSGSATMTVN